MNYHDTKESQEEGSKVPELKDNTNRGIKNLSSLPPTIESVKTVMRRVKAIRKKLSQIARQEKLGNKNLTEDQRNKIARKAPLAKELKDLDAWLLLSPELVEEETNRIEAKKKSLEKKNIKDLKKASAEGKKRDDKKQNGRMVCELCSVELDSAEDYKAHLQSKRHKKTLQRKPRAKAHTGQSERPSPATKAVDIKTPNVAYSQSWLCCACGMCIHF